MNIFTFKKTPPIIGHDDLWQKTLTHRQWAFVVDKWSIGFEHQNIYSDTERPLPIEGYAIGIETSWEIIRDYQGYDHLYHDGDYYSFRVGPIVLFWWY